MWAHSCHAKLVDVVINDALRLISGCITPTPVDMLPILAGIPPSRIRREHAVLKLAAKAYQSNSLIPTPALNDGPAQRIRRQNFTTLARDVGNTQPLSPSWPEDRWTSEWTLTNSPLRRFVETPSNTPPGIQLTRQAWVRLNRLRSGWGKTNAFLKLIGAQDFDSCQCGMIQTVNHIINSCLLLWRSSRRSRDTRTR